MQIAGKELDPDKTIDQLIFQIKALPSGFEQRKRVAPLPSDISLLKEGTAARQFYETAEFAYNQWETGEKDPLYLQEAAFYYDLAVKELETDKSTLAYKRCLTKYGQMKLLAGDYDAAEEALNAAVKAYFPHDNIFHSIKACTEWLAKARKEPVLHAHLSDALGLLYQATVRLAQKQEATGDKDGGKELRIGSESDEKAISSPDFHLGLRYIRGYLTLLFQQSRVQNNVNIRNEFPVLIEQGEMGVSAYRPMGTHGLFSCVIIMSHERELHQTVLAHMDDRNSLERLEKHLELWADNRTPLEIRLAGARTSAPQVAMGNLRKAVEFLKDKNVNIISSDILEKNQPTSFIVDPEDFSLQEGIVASHSRDDAIMRVIRVLQQENYSDLFLAYYDWNSRIGKVRIFPQSAQEKLKLFYENDIPLTLAEFQDNAELYAQRIYDWLESSDSRYPLWRAPILVNDMLGAMYAQQMLVSDVLTNDLGENLLHKLQADKGISEEKARLELSKLTLDFPVLIERGHVGSINKLKHTIRDILLDALDEPCIDINRMQQSILALHEPDAAWKSDLVPTQPDSYSSWVSKSSLPSTCAEETVFGFYGQSKPSSAWLFSSQRERHVGGRGGLANLI